MKKTKIIKTIIIMLIIIIIIVIINLIIIIVNIIIKIVILIIIIIIIINKNAKSYTSWLFFFKVSKCGEVKAAVLFGDTK
jgi:hypothetical protein